MGLDIAALLGVLGLGSIFGLVGVLVAGWMVWRVAAKAGFPGWLGLGTVLLTLTGIGSIVTVVMLWVFYGLPVVADIRLDVFAAAVVALALCDSPFEAEILRAGIQSIERGQREAALSLGLNEWQSFRTVVLPQAIRRVLPPIGNQFVYLVKMSSLASVIGAADLTRKANELVVTVFRPLEIYTVLIVEYLILVLLVSWAVRGLERRMAVGDRR